METDKQHRVYKLVLTGGPCGGKTTGQARISTFFENLGWKVFRVPETAAVLLSGGIKFSDLTADEASSNLDNTSNKRPCIRFQNGAPKASVDLIARLAAAAEKPCSEAFKFQENLLRTMIQIENTYFELGKSSVKNCLIICDRGAMDASAYICKDKWERLMAGNNWNAIELRDNRYNQIIHMVSAANGAEDSYSVEEHACRSEDVALAQELDYKSAAAWVGHPYFDVIDNSTDFETKMNRMIECVCQKLGIDTGDRLLRTSRKLKYLVSSLPLDSNFPEFQDFDVVHHYLQSAGPKVQARLRKRGQQGHWTYIHTIRRPHVHNQSVEVKTQLNHRDYMNLLAQSDDAHFTIYKKRRCFLVNNQYFQLDIYKEPSHPRCKGLILLETYSSLDGDSLRNCLPKFLDIVEEVTGNPNYSMFNLSLKEDWSKSRKFCHSLHGDPLALRFEILDEQSPYEIFVRELVAMDGTDNAEITLIDSQGCPTDHFIMGPIYKSAISGKILLSHFDAFKFPSSEVVQFRALVTPCMPTCEPVQCDQEDISGELRSLISYGRKRRALNDTETRRRRETSKQASPDDMLLVQSIQITDKFGFEKQQAAKPKSTSTSETVFYAPEVTGFCVNGLGLIVAGTVFLLAQLAVIAIWTFLYQRRRKQRSIDNATYGSSVPTPTLPGSRTDSLSKLYDHSFASRHGRQF